MDAATPQETMEITEDPEEMDSTEEEEGAKLEQASGLPLYYSRVPIHAKAQGTSEGAVCLFSKSIMVPLEEYTSCYSEDNCTGLFFNGKNRYITTT